MPQVNSWPRNRRGRPRDSQQRKVYEAGWEIASATGWLGERTARSLARTLGCSMKWSRKNLGLSASGWASYEGRLISINPNMHNAASMEILLHEVAHVWTYPDFAAHGAEFCRVLLDLTERVQGWDMRMLLSGAFVRHRVKVAPAGSVRLRWNLKTWEWPVAK